MNANLDLKSIKIKPLLGKAAKRFSRHAVFVVLLLVLLSYIFVVYKISGLAKAEPSSSQENTVTSSIPKIDKTAVNKIQSLEQSSSQIHALFEQARNNPF